MDDVTMIRRSASALSSRFGGGVSLMNVDDGLYYRLEASGADAWQRLGEPGTVRTLADHVAAVHGVDPRTALDDVRALVRTLFEAGLVESA